MKKILLLIILIFFSKISISGTVDPKISDTRYIDYGKKFTCVAKIKGIVEKENFISSCVLISNHWALTACHVVENADEIKIELNNKDFEIKKIITNKKFKKEIMAYHDIALCYSEISFGLDNYPNLYDGEYEKGKKATICGYGMTGTFSEGAIKFDEKKRAGTNLISEIYRNCLICNNYNDPNTELEFVIATGDSGGGLFIDGKLAGVNSYVFCKKNLKNSSYGCGSAHTRIKIYKKWIEDNIK